MAKKASSAIGGCASRRAKKQTSAARGGSVARREEGSVWFRRAVGVRGAKRRSRKTFRLVEKAAIGEDGAMTAVETRPNQSLEPTRMLGTSPAEQARVPSIRVAHL